MDLITANINNLTDFWKIGGKLAGRYIQDQDHHLSIATSGDWPNKLWFSSQLNTHALESVQLKWNLNKISIPIWGRDINEQALILKANGFYEQYKQIAMSINLKQELRLSKRLLVLKVTNASTAKIWSQTFQEAFGYEISTETINKTIQSINFFIAFHNEIPVGTAALFIDQFNIAGIHSMGIIPSERRKGYAEELLQCVLFEAKNKGCNYATLQASEMGKGLYLKTGFQEDFIIKTFANTIDKKNNGFIRQTQLAIRHKNLRSDKKDCKTRY